MEILLLVAIAGLAIGMGLQVSLKFYLERHARQQAESYAQDLLETAQEKAEEVMDFAKSSSSEYERSLFEKNEKDFFNHEEKNQKLQGQVDRLKNQLHSKWIEQKKEVDKELQSLMQMSNLLDSKQAKAQLLQMERDRKRSELIQLLSEKSQTEKDTVLDELTTKIVSRYRSQLIERLEQEEEKLKDHIEREAKKIINIALNRFVRPYCSERGIGFITLDNDRDVERMLGPNKSNIELIEKICGIDIIYNERAKSLSVSGFDPVRRELARATLEQLTKERIINEKVINNTVDNCKKKLFHQIKMDGNRVAKELKAEDLKPEIKNMMGALRYRYSFTQNQFFHCAEVGHLCGLLASELNEDIRDAKRSGLLHDIGKAMDHSIDGGHAVIGADFIEKNGEAHHIVHAVRAHHFDETPSTNLAYLVIAADAISGARPGARRSTTSTYLQKMNQLQEIGNSFDGVIDTFILSAGREVRITVDNQKIDDTKALELSKSIAKKIEHDCNYPGTIKVTVVRESQAVEMAR